MKFLAAALSALALLAAPRQSAPPAALKAVITESGTIVSADALDWLRAVAEHTVGENDAALARIESWEADRLTQALRDLHRMKPGAALNALLARAAMFHADLWLLRKADLGVPRGGWDDPGEVLLFTDGSPIRGGRLTGHVAFGRRIVRALRPVDTQQEATWDVTLASQPWVRQWFRALAAQFARRYNVADAKVHLRAARDVVPDDPYLLFDSGCAAETIASPPFQIALKARAPSLPSTERSNLEEAERHFRAALRRGDVPEARVRLARVVSQLGRPADAVALLQRGVGDRTPSVVRYFAALVLADALERTRRPEEALREYRKAAVIFPAAQTPHIVISRLERERGATEAAGAAMRAISGLVAEEGARLDPWWLYPMCNGRNADAEMRELRRLFADGAAR